MAANTGMHEGGTRSATSGRLSRLYGRGVTRPATLVGLAVSCVLLAVLGFGGCGPGGGAETVAFFLDLTAEELSRIQFVVTYSAGQFSGPDGGCEVGAAAGPRYVYDGQQDARKRAAATVLPVAGSSEAPSDGSDGGSGAATVSTSSTSTTTSSTVTLPSTTTTHGPTTTTTMHTGTAVCGNHKVESPEECDDGNTVSGDGCDANCKAEFAFTAVSSDNKQLTVTITNGKGIAPGATLAFCKFKRDGTSDPGFDIQTTICQLVDGTACAHPALNGGVSVSTTTTTTTTSTTTSSHTTTTSPGTTSTTLFPFHPRRGLRGR